MAESWLRGYKDVLVAMRRDQRMTLDQIIAFMERYHQRRVAKSTLSTFFKNLPEMQQPPEATEPRVSPEEQHFMAQAEVLEYVRQTSEALIQAMAQLHARQDVLETAAADRHQATHTGMQRLEDAIRELASTRSAPGQPDAMGVQVLFEELRRMAQAIEALRGRMNVSASTPPPAFFAPDAPASRPRKTRKFWLWAVLFLVVGACVLYTGWR